jgi:hypothetical protein
VSDVVWVEGGEQNLVLSVRIVDRAGGGYEVPAGGGNVVRLIPRSSPAQPVVAEAPATAPPPESALTPVEGGGDDLVIGVKVVDPKTGGGYEMTPGDGKVVRLIPRNSQPKPAPAEGPGTANVPAKPKVLPFRPPPE